MLTKRSALVAVAALSGATCLGHPGGLDANGGHHNRKTGDYHIHRPSYTPPERSAPTPSVTPQGIADFAGGRRTSGYRSAVRTTVRGQEPPKAKRQPPADLLDSVRAVGNLLRRSESTEDRRQAKIELASIAEAYEGTTEASEALRILHLIEAEEEAERSAADREAAAAADAAGREKKAQAKLRLAKTFVAARKPSQAKTWLRDAVDTYPETKAAAEARALLEQVETAARFAPSSVRPRE